MSVDPNIKQKASYIRTKQKGSEVRESLAAGLEAMSEDVVETVDRQDYVEQQLQAVYDSTKDKDVISAAELEAARVGADGAVYPNAKARMDAEQNKVNAQLAQTQQLLGGNILYEPPIASTEWATFEGVRRLDMNADEFLDLFYNPYLGEHDSYTLIKTSKGLDQSGNYDIWEYDYIPKNYTEEVLFSSGMHAYELPASFGLAHLFKHIMDESITHPAIIKLRNTRIKLIPIINPWGFNQAPEKTYGNSRGVNINRNFDSNGAWGTFPIVDPAVDEFNYKGTAPFSEAETKILRDWVIANKTAKFWIDCHTGAFNSAGDNWIYYLSKDPLAPEIQKALSQLESRIRTKYKKTPTKTVNIDHPGLIRANWSLEQQGMSTITIEQSAKNVPWSGDINNEGPDITEYEITIIAYALSMLGEDAEGFIPATNESIADLYNRLNFLMDSGLTIAYDSFERKDSNSLGTTDLGNKKWTVSRGQLGVVGNKAKALAPGDADAYVDAKVNKYTASVDIVFDTYAGLALRYENNYHFVIVRLNSTGIAISRYENSLTTFTKLGEHLFTPVKGTTYNLKAEVNGDVIKIYLDNVLVITATENKLTSVTNVGIKTLNDTVSTFDKFTITL